MTHWFDRFCTNLAKTEELGTSPRREFVRGAISVLALGSVTKRSAFGAATGTLQNPPIARPSSPTSLALPFKLNDRCQRQTSGKKVVQGLKIAASGMEIEHQLNYDAARKTLTTRIIARSGTHIVIDSLVSTSVNGTGSATIRYGPLITGVSQASFRLSPQRIEGTIDGRKVVALKNADGKISSTTFADRKPAPVLKADPGLAPKFTPLVKEASARLTACKSLAVAVRPATVAPRTAQVMDYKPGQNGPNDPGDGWRPAGGTYDAPDCDHCWDNCVDLAKDKSGIDDWTVWFCGPLCWATAIAIFNSVALVCWGTCQLPGGGCCPIPCGGAFTCCGRDTHCFQDSLCCPSNMVVCNNACCGQNIDSCSPDGSCGCPTGTINCGKSCCGVGQICCGGVCAAPKDCKNGVYCPDPSHICNGACCPPFNPCCNGQCCSGTCVNNVCCSDPKLVCGNTCCAAGQVCNNGSCLGCPSNRWTLKRYPCQSLNTNNQKVGTCCPITSPNCCGGLCCGFGQNYCTKANGNYVCTNVNPNPIH